MPGLNEGIFAAAMVISSPVCGLRPLRSVLALTSNEPKPIKVTGFPDARVVSMVSRKPSSARLASVLVRLACSAMAFINSDLFIKNSLN